MDAPSFTANLFSVLEFLEGFLPQLWHGLDPENALSNTHVWSKMDIVMPGTIRGYVRVLEKGTGSTMKWQNLMQWLKVVRQRLDSYHKNEVDVPSLKARTRLDESLRKLHRARKDVPSLQQLCERAITMNDPRSNAIRDTFGPNWNRHCSNISRLWSPVSSSQSAIPKSIFEPKIQNLCNEIMRLWQDLRQARLNGTLSRIEVFWEKTTFSERAQRLRRHFPHLSRGPQDYLFQWIRHKTLDESRPERTAFLTPMLNTEDLSKDRTLMVLLKVRSEFHPRIFRLSDSRSVLLGYWSDILPHLEVQGAVTFLAADLTSNETQYGAVYTDSRDLQRFSLTPAIAYYQLLAQALIYRFLKDIILMHSIIPEGQTTDSNEAGSRETQFDDLSKLPEWSQGTQENPVNIDFVRMLGLLKAAEEEALDELSQLRLDAELWALRMQAAKDSGRSSVVLRAAFGRVDTFSTLYQQVKSLAAGDRSSALGYPTCPSQYKTGTFEKTVLFYKALQAILNENLDRMQYLVWPELTSLPRPLNQLLELLRSDDAVLRVVGASAFIAAVQRELDATNARVKLPFELQRAITDLSVVASCMQETAKCTAFEISNGYMTDYDGAVLAGKKKSEWDFRARPWDSILQNMLRRLEMTAKLSNRRPTSETRNKQHLAFWLVVDTALLQEVENRSLAEMIMEYPLPLLQLPGTSGTDEVSGIVVTDRSSQPSRTQVKKSSGKAKQPENSPIRQTQICKSLARVPSISITKERDLDFWGMLDADNGPALSFRDFCRFMISVGYTLTPLPGSGRSFNFGQKDDFNHHSFVFHEPHGHNGDKLPWKVARRQWRDRLNRRIDVRTG